MKHAYLVLPVLCATPFLDSCTTVATSLASYGMKSVLEVRHATESPEAYYQLGRYYQAQNRFDEAVKAYERAVALKNDYVEAANALATSYAMQGRYELAIARLEAAIERSPGVGYLHNNLGYIYYLQGRYASAIASLEAATRLEPENGRAWRNLALAYGKSGAADESRDAYARADRATPHVAQVGGASHALSKEQQDHSVHEQTRRAPQAPAVLSATRPAAQIGSGATLIDASRSIAIVPVGPNIYELRPLTRTPELAAQPEAMTKSTATSASPAVKLSLRPFRLEVSNGNGKTGLARRIAERLKHAGMKAARITNQLPWQPGSEIQYSEGYAAEAAQLADLLGQEAMMVRNDRLRQDINVRLVLGKDVRNETALIKSHDSAFAMTLASAK